jgi:hypothetical protein
MPLGLLVTVPAPPPTIWTFSVARLLLLNGSSSTIGPLRDSDCGWDGDVWRSHAATNNVAQRKADNPIRSENFMMASAKLVQVGAQPWLTLIALAGFLSNVHHEGQKKKRPES